MRLIPLLGLLACADAYPIEPDTAVGESIVVRQVDVMMCEPASDDAVPPAIQITLEPGEEMPAVVLKCAADTCQLVTSAIMWHVSDVTADEMDGIFHLNCSEGYTYRIVRLIPMG